MFNYWCKTENIVGNSRLSKGELELDFENLVENKKDDVHKINYTDRQPGIKIERKENSPTVTIYKSGKYNIAGAKLEQELERENDWVINFMSSEYNVEEDVALENLKIHNILVKVELDMEINLNELNSNGLKKENIEYVPERFSGLRYYSDKYECDFSIFSTGYIITLGSKEFEQCAEDIEKFVNGEFKQTVEDNSKILVRHPGEDEEEEKDDGPVSVKELKKASKNIGITEDS